MRMRPEPRASMALVVLALVAAACSGGPERGVGVRSIATDIAFVPPEETIEAAPAGLVPEDRGIGLVVEGPAAQGPDTPIPTPPPPDCPFAPLTAAPKVVAPVDVTDRPEVGRYRWIIDGYQHTAQFGRVSLSGQTFRSVLEVAESPNGFTFVVEERDMQVGSGATVQTTYEVSDGSSVQADGIYLTKITTITSGGGQSEFDPAPPILLFPLPAEIGQSPTGVGVFVDGEQMDTTGIDPSTQRSLRHAGTTTGKMHVDACGELVDAYYVEANQEWVNARGDSFQRRYNYAVATQMGGMLVFEEIGRPCPNTDEEGNCSPEPELAFEANLGQIEPDPLPSG